MLFSFNFYSSLLLVIICNGLLYTVLLFINAIRGEKANGWLALFTALCMFYITPWMLGFAGWYDDPGYRELIFYIPFTHTFFIGPVFYFYLQSFLNPAFRLRRKSLVHLLPGLLYILYNIVVVVTDKLILDKVYFLAEGSDLEFDTWYKVTGWLSMAIYFILSARYYTQFREIMTNTVSFADALLFRWLKEALNAFVAMLAIKIIYTTFFILYPEFENYTTSWWFYFFFGCIAVYVAIKGYNSRAATAQPYLVEHDTVLLLGRDNSEPEDELLLNDNSKANVEGPPPAEWQAAIEATMKGGAYQNPELTLPLLAKSLSSNSATISRAINYYFGLNFNDYINSLRVEAVKTALNDKLHHQQTLLAIALDNGFNSKATFNRAFRKHTGVTPTEYIKSLI